MSRSRRAKTKRSPKTVIAVLLIVIVVLTVLLGVLSLRNHSSVRRSDAAAIVCVDAGHGGSDPGASGLDRTEKDDTLAAAQALKKALEARNIYVVMTRDNDSTLTLDERVSRAEKEHADYFISLHRNVAEVGNGVEIWVAEQCSTASLALADGIHSGLIDAGVQNDRGVRRGSQSGSGDYYVLSHTSMPAVLVELGFMQDEGDNALFDQNLNAYADAIADAVAGVNRR